MASGASREFVSFDVPSRENLIIHVSSIQPASIGVWSQSRDSSEKFFRMDVKIGATSKRRINHRIHTRLNEDYTLMPMPHASKWHVCVAVFVYHVMLRTTQDSTIIVLLP